MVVTSNDLRYKMEDVVAFLKTGGEVIITRRGKYFARLSAIVSSDSKGVDESARRLLNQIQSLSTENTLTAVERGKTENESKNESEKEGR